MSLYLKGRSYALQLVATQVGITVLISIAGFLIDNQKALSLLIGGIICALANAVLALIAFRPQLGATPNKMLAAFYSGEVAKFVVVALLCLLAFRQLELLKDAGNAVALFAGYLVAQAVVWVFPLLKK